jgi:hypothetical protein
MRATQHRAVQALFTAEVIVDRRDVGVRALADLAHGRAAISFLREDLASCVEEAARRDGAGICSAAG